MSYNIHLGGCIFPNWSLNVSRINTPKYSKNFPKKQIMQKKLRAESYLKKNIIWNISISTFNWI